MIFQFDLFSSYIHFYCIVALSLIIVRYFTSPKWKDECINWLYSLNTLLLIIDCLFIVQYFLELFWAWYGQNPWEWYVFKGSGGPYGWSFWVLLFLNYFVVQLFWFKRLKKSIGFSLIVVAILSASSWIERLTILITSMYQDYLPSAWSTSYAFSGQDMLQYISKIIFFTTITFATYWIIHKRKKLPFPSALLSFSLFFISYSSLQCIQHFN